MGNNASSGGKHAGPARTPSPSSRSRSTNGRSGSNESQRESFHKSEMSILQSMFKDLAARSPHDTMDKETFLKFFDLPGLLGERLFVVFDRRKDGVIHWDEFLNGLERYSQGSTDEKLMMLYRIFDMGCDGGVSPEELSMMLNSLITAPGAIRKARSGSDPKEKLPDVGAVADSFKSKTVEDIVAKAFMTCDLSHDGKLQYDEFRQWTKQQPHIVQSLEKALVSQFWCDPRAMGEKPSAEAAAAAAGCGWGCRLSSEQGFSKCVQCGEVVVPTKDKVPISANFDFNSVFHEGQLWKKAKLPRRGWQERYFIVKGSFMYYYTTRNDKNVRNVYFLDGCSVEEERDAAAEEQGRWAFRISCPKHGGKEMWTKLLFANSEATRNTWVAELQKAAHGQAFEQYYVLGENIGEGKFATVFKATNIRTKAVVAAKVIRKVKGQEEATAALRTEIAILKLLHHPRIIKMEAVFETKDTIYIVMPLMAGGDLFDRIVRRVRFAEDKALLVLWRLLDAIKYIHDRGIIHRDLKPENVLCVDEKDDADVVLTDFGLSSFAYPTQLLSNTCGTLNYVAPEVLKLRGYSKSVDIWSIGVIGYILVRGGFPFSGDTNAEVIEQTLNKEPSFSSSVFEKVSKDYIDLIKGLLKKEPKARLSIAAAMEHPAFREIRTRKPSRDVEL